MASHTGNHELKIISALFLRSTTTDPIRDVTLDNNLLSGDDDYDEEYYYYDDDYYEYEAVRIEMIWVPKFSEYL